MYKLDLEKAEESETKLPASIESSKRQESSRKTSTFASLSMIKPLTLWITTNYGKFLKRWEYQVTLPVLYEGKEALVRIRHGIMNWFKIGEEVRQGCILSH